MKYNFTDNVRRSLAQARTEAVELKHAYVDPTHILLGMIQIRECRGTELLARLGIDEESVRSEVIHYVSPGRDEVTTGELPYTTRAKKVLEYSMTAARDRKDPHVGTEHLLLGLLREEKGIAAQMLVGLGATRKEVEAILAGHVPSPREPRSGSDTPDEPRLRIEIDDQSDRSIYEQIVARVKEAVAVGEVGPGERLPPVRGLADHLDIAPGTVARAYSELERLGVVVTEGARGTRVAPSASPAPKGTLDLESIAGLLRPAAVAAFHMGSGADDLRQALELAMQGIFED